MPTLPPLDDASEWEEVSGVHARYTKSGTLLQIEVTGGRKRLTKLIRGVWQALTFREKVRVITFVGQALFGSGALGHYLPIWIHMVLHGR